MKIYDPKYDKKPNVPKSGEGEDVGTTNNTTEDNSSYYPGYFDFNSMMQDFYGAEVKDEDGNIDKDTQMIKTAFQGGLIQSAVDAQIASAMAQQNAAIAQDNMTAQANLELFNTSELMDREFGYNQLAQESTFNYENQFANAQYDRDIGMLAASGEQNRLNMQEQGQQDRLGEIVAGEQNRLTAALNNASLEAIKAGEFAADNYQADASAQASMYGADATRDAMTDVARTEAESALDVTGLQTGSAERIAETQKNAATEVADTRAEADVAVAGLAADASTYGAERVLEGTKFSSVAEREAAMYGADRSLDAATRQAEASEEVAETRAGADVTVAKEQAGASRDVATTQGESAEAVAITKAGADVKGAELAKEASTYGADRALEGTKDTNITSTRNIGETGKQTRETMGLENRLKAKDRADMHRYARSTARAM